MPRRSRRLGKAQLPEVEEEKKEEEIHQSKDDHDDDESVMDSPKRVFFFDGTEYKTYQEMVQAKRERNQKLLQDSGLLSAVEAAKDVMIGSNNKTASTLGIKKRKVKKEDEKPRIMRKSRRLAGKQSDGLYVDSEKAGKFTIVDDNNHVILGMEEVKAPEPKFYNNRINDGSEITVEEAVVNTGSKWCKENSTTLANDFVTSVLQKSMNQSSYPSVAGSPKESSQRGKKSSRKTSPRGVMQDISSCDTTTVNSSKWIQSQVDALNVDHPEQCVAKVCPERIYGIAVHPSTDKLIVSAGDKTGYVGIWNADHAKSLNGNESDDTTSDDGVHLFRFHNGAVPSLHWTGSGSSLFSTSYDGTLRWFDVETQKFEEIFATYDDDNLFKDTLGYGLDVGHSFWTQYGCLDHRFGNNEKCVFLSTSVGTAMHLDLRVASSSTRKSNGRITFHEQLGDKKINTLSLHPDGYSLMSAGLDCVVRVWDIRKMGDSRTRKSAKLSPDPVAMFNGGRSVNSSYFSPSGQFAIATTMGNKMDIFENMHLGAGEDSKKKNVIVKPVNRMYHDNHTGRWLSTFMATFHPSLDIFCVGSMQKPRAVEIFDPSSGGRLIRSITGDALTAVASRCCFHPRSDKIVLVGGNSSGRVTVFR